MDKTITRGEAETLADAINGELREKYSGRMMYGRESFGITYRDIGDLVQLGYIIASVFSTEEATDDMRDLLISVDCYDSELARARKGEALSQAAVVDGMGTGYIVYFPGWTIS